jgi:hypothetical protein
MTRTRLCGSGGVGQSNEFGNEGGPYPGQEGIAFLIVAEDAFFGRRAAHPLLDAAPGSFRGWDSSVPRVAARMLRLLF